MQADVDPESSYPHMGRVESALDGPFWEERYALGETDWDKGHLSPGLEDFLRDEVYTTGRVLVPGCGRGHDARALARAGFEVTGLDIAAVPVRDAAAIAAGEKLDNVRFVQGDFFRDTAAWEGQFDWVFEHTFFCAIDPALRDQYVERVARLLDHGGQLLGIFFNIQPEEGPPFGTTREELRERFGRRFELVTERVPRSYPNRVGQELLMLWRKRADG